MCSRVHYASTELNWIVLKGYTFTLLKEGIKNTSHVKWVPFHHGMARPQIADRGEGLHIWRVASNILNKQSRTANKGWPSSLGVGRGVNNSPP
jgi:hypothetical protein